MNSSGQYWRFSPVGCPIRKSTDQRLLAASRGLSQLAASFIACWHQGIHRIALSSLITKVFSLLPSLIAQGPALSNSANCTLFALIIYLYTVVKELAHAISPLNPFYKAQRRGSNQNSYPSKTVYCSCPSPTFCNLHSAICI